MRRRILRRVVLNTHRQREGWNNQVKDNTILRDSDKEKDKLIVARRSKVDCKRKLKWGVENI